MPRPRLLFSLAWLCYLVAWFVPVIKDGVTLPTGIPGWQAFYVALNAFMPSGQLAFNHWWIQFLVGTSAVSNALFLVALVGLFLKKRSFLIVMGCLSLVSYAINSHWFIMFGRERSDLRIGYYLWWVSFILLGFALFDFAKSESCRDNRSAKAAGTQ